MSDGPCAGCRVQQQEVGVFARDVAKLVRALRLEFHADPAIRQAAAAVAQSASRLELRSAFQRASSPGKSIRINRA